MLTSNIRMEANMAPEWFWLGPDCWCWFLKLMISRDFHAQQSPEVLLRTVKKETNQREDKPCRRKRPVDDRGQRKVVRLFGAERKATVTQRTTLYNRGEQRGSGWTKPRGGWDRVAEIWAAATVTSNLKPWVWYIGLVCWNQKEPYLE